jgi:hypothetical protein
VIFSSEVGFKEILSRKDGKREEGRGKREEGRGKRKAGREAGSGFPGFSY